MKANCRLKGEYTPRRMQQRMFSIMLLALLVPISVLGQNKAMVTGYVFDTYNEPLVGAMVKVSDSTISVGTYTGLQGEFSLEIKEGTKLEISFIGYDTQYVTARNGMKILLSESTKALDEIVVVGYGTVKKSDLTGAVSSVTSRDFLDQPASSANSVLSGRVAGVAVRRASGNPGEGNTIRIRGANSIYGGNDPLIVVDGNYGGMPHIEDIESIEILKDASATAIYGSRGANGVIIVTTKRGKEGKPNVKFSTNFSVNKVLKHYDLMNAMEFANYNKEVGTYPFSDDEMALVKANPCGVNWQNEVLQTALIQDYKIVVSGGTDKFKYYVSPHYYNNTGVIRNSKSEGYGIKSKIDIKLNNSVLMKVEIDAGHGDVLNQYYGSAGSSTSHPLMAALLWSPTEPVYDEDGQLNRLGIGTGTILNPKLLVSPEERYYSNWANAVGNLNINILDGLSLALNGKVGFSTGGTRKFVSKNYTGTNAAANQVSYENLNWLINAVLNYNKTFAKVHHFSAMLGFEQSASSNQNFRADALSLPIESVSWYNLGLAAPNISIGSGYGNDALISYFSRLNYNYNYKYYLTANFRVDGSSKFRPGKRYGYFPSFSAAWRISEEEFMKDQNVFQNIKLRVSWGMTGNQAVGAYSTYSILNPRANSWGTGSLQSGYYPVIGGNPNLTWESTKQYNLGLDLSFLNNRVSLSFDYYNKKTVDLLAPIAVPGYNGGDSEYGEKNVISNVGSVRNEGLEFNMNVDVVKTKKISYDINFNGAINKNEVLSLGDSPIIYGDRYAHGLTSTSPFALIPGKPIGTIYGLKYLGIWQENQAEEAQKYGQTPGDYRYDDLNGDNNYTAEDNQVIGNTNPKFTWGVNNHVSYKNFDFNILLEGSHGRDVLNWTYMTTVEKTRSSTYTNLDARNRWTPQNPNAKFAKIGETNRLNPVSSQYMEDASYVKLRNISVSYKFPRRLIPFVALQLSLSAQNILTITKYKGYDPEVSSSIGSDMNSGMDWYAYPNPASFSFGLSITY